MIQYVNAKPEFFTLIKPNSCSFCFSAAKQAEIKSATPVVTSTTQSNSSNNSSSFYNNSASSAQPTPRANSNRVYNGGAPASSMETPTNIHPISSLTPYQNRYLLLFNLLFFVGIYFVII